ncbi:MAG: hypothetical protein AMXMBFR84_14030 [Candidatus Hydrogenedentota bacterium]
MEIGLTRRQFLAGTSAMALGCARPVAADPVSSGASNQPYNVLLIIADDMGYGDLACHGNPYISTPHLDQLRQESTRFKRFYVSPVCSPTRASLMTGRYNFRTGAVDTFMGRSTMFPDEVTLAEIMREAGYATGLFGKWHLGDTFPSRPSDSGFQEVLCHMGGGIGQPSDPPGNGYFDPILQHNGEFVPVQGYCTDIFANATIEFMKVNRDRPFFAYLSTNAPHGPLEIAGRYYHRYASMGLDEQTARVYGMVENLDENVGNILSALTELGLAENTIVLFLTDNGPQASPVGVRFNSGMRGSKTTVYEGGIRVPCFVRFPGRIKADRDIEQIAGHIDLMPTLLDMCDIPYTSEKKLDGISLKPLLEGESGNDPDRKLVLQWHRGEIPQPYRNCAVVTQQYKLINGTELYDISNDPGEERDLAVVQPGTVDALRNVYDAWFEEMRAERNFELPRVWVGAPEQNPVTLTRQDWRGDNKWDDTDVANRWEIQVVHEGRYDITLRYGRYRKPHTAQLKVMGNSYSQTLTGDTSECRFSSIELPQGAGQLSALISADDRDYTALYVDVKRL